MAYTFLTLYSEVANNFDTQTTTRVKAWVNDAVSEIISRRRWSWLETLATVASISGTADYVLVGTAPVVTDFDTMISVRHNQAAAGTTFVKLQYLNQQAFDDLVAPAGATPGIPIYYTIRGGAAQSTSGAILAGGNQTLSVWPVPNYIGSFKIAYFRSVGSVEMAADSDIPLPPVQFRNAIELLALAIGKGKTDQLIASNVAMSNAEAAIGSLLRADTVNRTGDPSEDDTPTVAGRMPANPNAGADPGNSPYGWESES